MCKRRALPTALAAAVIAMGAAGTADEAYAQSSADRPTEEELVRRVEALRPALEEARGAVEEAQRQRQALAASEPRRPTAVVEVGPLRIIAPPGQADLAAELFGDVWRRDFHGVTGSPALSDGFFVFQWAWRRAEPLRPDPSVVADAELHRVELTRAWARTRGVARARIRDALWFVLQDELPEGSPLGRWVGSTSYPVTELVSRRLAATPSRAGRACLEGDRGACLTAFGLAGEPLGVPPETPAMILLEAIRLGGDGAWERLLVEADAAPMDALAHAARMEPGEVVAAWRRTVLDERPEIHAGLGGQAARVLLWVLALAAFATRSTRWRLP
jgi:hypothetical protein